MVSKSRSGRPWGVDGVEDHLLVLLILYQCAITQNFMACLYQANKSTVKYSCVLAVTWLFLQQVNYNTSFHFTS